MDPILNVSAYRFVPVQDTTALQVAVLAGAVMIVLLHVMLGDASLRFRLQPGEAISQRIVGAFLAELFDAVITVDPHLHRVATLEEAIPLRDAIVRDLPSMLGHHLDAHGEPGASRDALRAAIAARTCSPVCGVKRRTASACQGRPAYTGRTKSGMKNR